MYKCLLYYFDHEYTKSEECIASFLRDVKDSKYHENFIRALKYMMDNKPMKVIANFETCYQITLKNGQYDRAIFVLKQLNELYILILDYKINYLLIYNRVVDKAFIYGYI